MQPYIQLIAGLWCILVYGATGDQQPASLEKRGGLKGNAELLKIVAEAHLANKERIQTWSGRATIEDQSYEEGRTTKERRLKSSVRFAYDRQREATRWNYRQEEDRWVIDNNDVKINRKPYLNNGMKKDGVFYQLYNYKEDSDETRTMAIRPLRYAEGGMFSEDFDPIWYLTNAGENLAERLEFYYRNANNPNISDAEVTADGNQVVLEITSPGVINRYKFDLSAGGNLVSYFGSDSQVTGWYYWRYQKLKDIWVPESFTYINVNAAKYAEGKHKFWRNSIRRVEFAENVINEPIDAAEFSFAKIGLRPGDRIYDGRTGRDYEFGQKGATEADMPPRMPRIIESITGKLLPEIQEFGVKLSAVDVNDRMILVCFWDMNQRPSRNCIMQLAKQAEQLKEKGVTIVAIQSTKIDQTTLNNWVKKYNIPFAVGMIADDEEKIRFEWGVKALPWLILTNRKHIIITEGFGISELSEKVGEAVDVER
jgi:peroxiredoxin